MGVCGDDSLIVDVGRGEGHFLIMGVTGGNFLIVGLYGVTS